MHNQLLQIKPARSIKNPLITLHKDVTVGSAIDPHAFL